MRLAILNIGVLAALAAAGLAGWLDGFVLEDTTRISPAIFGITTACVVALMFGVRRLAEVFRDWTVLLGLIGTVIGFIVALQAVDPAAAGDVTQVAGVIGAVIEGMGIAMYTTLAGAICYLWLDAALRT